MTSLVHMLKRLFGMTSQVRSPHDTAHGLCQTSGVLLLRGHEQRVDEKCMVGGGEVCAGCALIAHVEEQHLGVALHNGATGTGLTLTGTQNEARRVGEDCLVAPHLLERLPLK